MVTRLFILVFISLLAIVGLSSAQEEGMAHIEKRELEEIREQIAQLKLSLNTRAVERDGLAGDLQQAELAISEKRLQVADVERQRDEHKKNKAAINSTLIARTADLAIDLKKLAAQIVVVYTSGNQERIKLLLQQDDPATLGRLLTYYRYMSEFRGNAIKAVNDHIAELTRLRASEALTETRLMSVAETQSAQLVELDLAQEKRERLLASLEARIDQVGSEIRRLTQQEKDLIELIQELTNLVPNYPITSEVPFSALRGQLTWPVTGRLVHDFGQSRSGGNVKWNGIVVSAPRGREIRAIHHGRVIFADWLVGMGLLIIIDHGEGYMTLYGYNETTLKMAGDRVDPGDVIATVGDSGGQQQTGLYFEIRHRTKPLNPRRWFDGQLNTG